MKNVTAKWALENKDSINIIDVRTPLEYSQDHIEGSKNIPMAGLLFNDSEFLNKNDTYYIICRSGARSANTVMQLETKGYDVINVEGGNAAIGRA